MGGEQRLKCPLDAAGPEEGEEEEEEAVVVDHQGGEAAVVDHLGGDQDMTITARHAGPLLHAEVDLAAGPTLPLTPSVMAAETVTEVAAETATEVQAAASVVANTDLLLIYCWYQNILGNLWREFLFMKFSVMFACLLGSFERIRHEHLRKGSIKILSCPFCSVCSYGKCVTVYIVVCVHVCASLLSCSVSVLLCKGRCMG